MPIQRAALIDKEANARWYRPIDAWDRGTAEALRLFRESAPASD
jgi:hypothetical protein